MGAFFLARQRRELTVWLAQLTTRTLEVNGQKIKLSATKMLPVEADSAHGIGLDFPAPERKLVLSQLVRYLTSDDTEKMLRELGLPSEPAAR